jgi:hypothetical protein
MRPFITALLLSACLVIALADNNDYCNEVNISIVTRLSVDCNTEITTITALTPTDPSLRQRTTCSVNCTVTYNYFKRFSGCDQVLAIIGGPSLPFGAAVRGQIFAALDARCTIDVDLVPPKPQLANLTYYDPCPPPIKARGFEFTSYVLTNCTIADNMNPTSSDCTFQCQFALNALSRVYHQCRDEGFYLDSLNPPLFRQKVRAVNAACTMRQIEQQAIICLTTFNASIANMRASCTDLNACSTDCATAVRRQVALIQRCGRVLFDNGVAPAPALIDIVRRFKFLCGVVSVDVNVTVSRDEQSIDIFSRDSTNPNQPQSRYNLISRNTTEFIAERWDTLTAIRNGPTRRIVTRIKQMIEFVPRSGFDSDTDYMTSGFDATKDTVVRIHDLEVNGSTGFFEDLGEIPLFNDPNNVNDTTGVFRRLFRSVILYGPLRLARMVVTFITTNIRNGIGSGQVTRPGDLSFNIVLENIPWTSDNTVMALVIDHDVDIDDATTTITNDTGFEVDPMAPPYADVSEQAIQFSDITRFRFRKRVYCDGTKTIVVRVRYIKVVGETPSRGLVVRKRLFVTFHSDLNGRCRRIFFDPSMDNTVNSDPNYTPSTDTSGSTASGSGSSASGSGSSASGSNAGTNTGSTGGTNTGSTSGAVALSFGLLSLLFVLFF